MWWNISWELKRCLKTLLIVYTCYCVTDAHVFSTSSIPVTVTINKFHPSTPCSTTTGRTKPLFFERVLGLHAKTPFQFDIDKWHELVKCGLFRNLTARTSMAPDGGVVLHVTGDELPSSSLAPEVSVIASLDNPEVVGGVKWRDDNFRGMGDKLEVSVTKKEGLEGNSMSLYPDMLLRWSGNSIGSTASISMSTNQESNFRALADLIPRYITKEFEETSLNRFLIRQQPTRSSVTTAKFQVAPPANFFRKSGWGDLLDSLSCSVEPFLRTHSSGDSLGDVVRCSAVGGTHRINLGTVGGTLVKLWHEAGTHMLHDGGFLFGRKVPAKGELFNQVGLKIDLPALSLLCGKPPIIRWDTFLPSFGMKASNVTALASMPTAPAATDSKLRLIGKIKLQAMKSWGKGCVPMNHEASIASPYVLRGLVPSSSSSSSSSSTSSSSLSSTRGSRTEDGVSGFAAVKTDVYLKGLLPAAASLGLFLDAGVHACNSAGDDTDTFRNSKQVSVDHLPRRHLGIATAGLSLRMLGFRVDYGLPVTMDRPAQVHFSLDSGD